MKINTTKMYFSKNVAIQYALGYVIWVNSTDLTNVDGLVATVGPISIRVMKKDEKDYCLPWKLYGGHGFDRKMDLGWIVELSSADKWDYSREYLAVELMIRADSIECGENRENPLPVFIWTEEADGHALFARGQKGIVLSQWWRDTRSSPSLEAYTVLDF